MKQEPTLFTLMATANGDTRFTLNPDLLGEIIGDPNDGGHVSPDSLQHLINMLQERLRMEKPARGKTHISVGVKMRRADHDWPAILQHPEVKPYIGKTPEDRDRFRRAVKRRIKLEQSRRGEMNFVELILNDCPQSQGMMIEILEVAVEENPTMVHLLKTAREFRCTKGAPK